MTNVTDYKNAGHVCFQEIWITIELPTVRPLAIAGEVRAGIDEAALITLDNVRKPICIWRCSDHDEQRIRRHFVDLVRFGTVNGNGFEMILAVRFDDGGIELDLNVWRRLQLIDQ